MSRNLLFIALVALAAPPLGLALAPLPDGTLPSFVPEVATGFVVQPFFPAPVPTALAFGPGDADGLDLYATSLAGPVFRFSLLWTPAGPVVAGLGAVAQGFSNPLGIVFAGDAMYVADSHPGQESERTDGRVTRVAADGTKAVVVDGLPNGRHNTNHLRFGPDGRMYMANGNSNDDGVAGGDPDVFPYSGAILSVDADEVSASPAVLHWDDEQGNPIPLDQIATHPRNADFNAKVHVLASGFRNVFGIAFSPVGLGYTGMNGADDPPSQDALFRIVPGAGTDFGFPFCFNEGPPGGVGAQVMVVPNPTFNDPARCLGREPATALLGWHTCATGLDFPTAGPWAFPESMRDDVFVGECAFFFVDGTIATQPVTHNLSHKVVRVTFDAQGHAMEVRDFLFPLALPTDVLFGPDGAMYVADAGAVYRVIPAL